MTPERCALLSQARPKPMSTSPVVRSANCQERRAERLCQRVMSEPLGAAGGRARGGRAPVSFWCVSPGAKSGRRRRRGALQDVVDRPTSSARSPAPAVAPIGPRVAPPCHPASARLPPTLGIRPIIQPAVVQIPLLASTLHARCPVLVARIRSSLSACFVGLCAHQKPWTTSRRAHLHP
jgi:hypothetical protein